MEDSLFADWWQKSRQEQQKTEIKLPGDERIPLNLTPKYQLRIPAELKSAVQQRWRQQREKKDASQQQAASEFLLWADFLDCIVSWPTTDDNSNGDQIKSSSRLYLLKLALVKLVSSCGGLDVFSYLASSESAAQLSSEQTRHVIKTYNAALCQVKSSDLQLPLPKPAILNDSAAKIALSFAGQANPWLPELQMLYQLHPSVRSTIETICGDILHNAKDSSVSNLFHGPVDILSWITGGQSVSEEQAAFAPVSFPMIGLTQLLQYYTLLQTWEFKKPSDALKHFSAAVGHSQGLISAVAVATASDSDESVLSYIQKAVLSLFWIGCRLQQASPVPSTASSSELVRQSVEKGHSAPTPMLAVWGLPPAELDAIIARVNKMVSRQSDSAARSLHIGLRNGNNDGLVVCGHPDSLHALVEAVHRTYAPVNPDGTSRIDQSRIPSSKRKFEPNLTYLTVSVPFHTPLVASAQEAAMSDLQKHQLLFDPADMMIPVLSTLDGKNISSECSKMTPTEFTAALLRLVCAEPVHWTSNTHELLRTYKVSHIVDFGPGRAISQITSRNLDGEGVMVVSANLDDMDTAKSHSRWVLFDPRPEAIPFAPNWALQYAPKVVCRRSDGKLILQTKFTDVVGRPPLLVAGMTPTTTNTHLVAACSEAGYYCELAGGGYATEALWRSAVSNLVSQLSASPKTIGNGVVANLLFLNQRLWSFQHSSLVSMREDEGVPIEGITIAAGVPSTERATELLAEYRRVGIKYVSFKPGSVSAIKQVVEIASVNPSTTIILQWTGGRGGGHHSFEDFHQPVLATYSAIRRQKNIVLVAGSGFGDAEGSWPYLTGDWSVRFGVARMPFDAILLGSRIMVAKEASTADSAKTLLVSTEGLDPTKEKEWEKSYDHVVGGIATVRSELGEPIHKVATRGLLFWRDLDREIFSIVPKEKQAAKIEEKKQWLISRLNADFQKVYFGRRADGQVVDLPDMTYAEVTHRMVDLMTTQPPPKASDKLVKQWIHPDYCKMTLAFVSRIEERFCGSAQSSKLPDEHLALSQPVAWASLAMQAYPETKTQLISAEDCDFFLYLCKRRGQKPPNFVPIIDKDLETWVKKDSLWYSENILALPEQDIQRAIILQGPVAVHYSAKANEPVADILNSIHDGWISLAKGTGEIASVEHVGLITSALSPSSPAQYDLLPAAGSKTNAKTLKFIMKPLAAPPSSAQLGSDPLPSPPLRPSLGSSSLSEDNSSHQEKWRDMLSQSAASNFRRASWWLAVLTSPHVVTGESGRYIPNTLSNLFTYQSGAFVEFETDLSRNLLCVTMLLNQESLLVSCKFDPVTLLISLDVHNQGKFLHLEYNYRPDQSWAPLSCSAESKQIAVIKSFYQSLWFGPEDEKALNLNQLPEVAVFSHEYVVSRSALESYLRSVGRLPSVTDATTKLSAPIDFAIVASWKSLVAPLFLKDIPGDLLRLVHLSNGFKQMHRNATMVFSEGDSVSCEARVTEISNTPSGLIVGVRALLHKKSVPSQEESVEVVSKFLFRRTRASPHITFKRETLIRRLDLSSSSAAVLATKKWSKIEGSVKLDRIATCFIHVENLEKPNMDNSSNLDVVTSGSIWTQYDADQGTCRGEKIGIIEYKASGVTSGAVLSFLQRFSKPVHSAAFFEHDGVNIDSAAVSIKAPTQNDTYSRSSGDTNPIHTNQRLAMMAELPTTVVHGMWTSAACAGLAADLVARGFSHRLRSITAEFVDYVHPGDELETSAKHVGMRDGRWIVEIRCTSKATLRPVLKAQADIEGPRTAHVFTGQGSAEPGMGMDLYESSQVAQTLWKRANEHFLATYGISILDIVKNNPKERTVFFGGRRGAQIRENYRKLMHESRPVFPQVNDSSDKITFSHPEGLLYATQFSQPALVLVELAAFRDMESRGLIPHNSFFAGHSLGEYAALAAVGNVLTVEALVDIVFLRGMAMQNAVVRDANGRSPYGMVAVNPSRVHSRNFSAKHLHMIIDGITESRKTAGEIDLIQVVNYNVENYQYVVAGEIKNLRSLGLILDALKASGNSLVEYLTTPVKLNELIASSMKQSEDQGYSSLQRGQATIPLAGIDVPFHSRFLMSGVPGFRQTLRDRMKPEAFKPEFLVGRYIPNVLAEPFAATRQFAQILFDQTKSAPIGVMLAKTDKEWAEIPPQVICYELLVELLAFQFASPVRWIETQNLLFTQLRTELLIEIGPAPTLFTMAKRTVEVLDAMNPFVQREILWFNRDKSKIYFESASNPSSNVDLLKPPVVISAVPAPAAAPVIGVPTTSSNGPALPEEPPSALDFIQTLVSLKSKQPLSSVGNDASLKSVSSGKSALQNELQGEMEAEFESSKAALQQAGNISELPLQQLAALVQPTYTQPGKRSTDLVNKSLARLLPGGYAIAQARAYLAKVWGISTQNRQHNVFVVSLSAEPSARFDAIASAEEWLDKVVSTYATRHAISVSKVSSAASAAPISVGTPSSGSGAAPSIPDQPPSALDAIRIIVSVKMKKPLETISSGATLKDLAGGKSALQNEVVGDLIKEFGITSEPNGVTEMDLQSLAGALSSKSGYQRLGPVSAALVARLISTKMPAGFTHPTIRSHLRTRFGLGDCRAEAVMLHALPVEPVARLQTEGDARAFWDSTAMAYAKSTGLDLSSATASAGSFTVANSVVDTQIRSDLDALFQRQIRALHSFLEPKESVVGDRARFEVLQNQLSELEQHVRMWNDEHGGSAYFDGLAPVFDSRKERVFDSYWAWVKQDCLSLFYDYACGRAPAWNLEVRNRIYHIKNRSTPEALEMVEYYKTKAEKDGFPEIVRFISMLHEALSASLSSASRYRELYRPQKPVVNIDSTGSVIYKEIDRPSSKDMLDYVVEMFSGRPTHLSEPQGPRTPYLFVQQQIGQKDPMDERRTDMFFSVLRKLAADGIGFTGKVALITGCGEGSIGIEILKALLSGGATVYATTSRFDGERVAKLYQQAYNDRGAKGSKLILLPFNQASKSDIDNLIEHIYSSGKDVDYVIPFAAISENGRDITDIDARSELAHRVMLTNTIRLIGAVANKKRSLGIITRPAHILLPLSPNHGQFGSDGLYAESKLGLEALMNKWNSESWSDYISLAGAVIGWTRGTNLMAQNNAVAAAMEDKHLVRTFSSREMTFNLMALLHPDVVSDAQLNGPIVADLNGALHLIADLNAAMSSIREQMQEESTRQRIIHSEQSLEVEIQHGATSSAPQEPKKVAPRANVGASFPNIPASRRLESIRARLPSGLLDLSKVIVCVGYGEVGPYGSARTRWEMEAYSQLSLSGCIELSWSMGLIKYKAGDDGWSGWTDASTGERLRDSDVPQRYRTVILENTGVRFVHPSLFDGYDPKNKLNLQQIALDSEMEPIEVSEQDAIAFVKRHGPEQCESWASKEDPSRFYVRLKKGAVIYIPKSSKFSRLVAGQVPTTWDPQVFGIPQEIASQVDRVTLYTLVSAVEAMVAAGICDPYELYEYVHVSEVGNTIGGGVGGMQAIRDIYRGRLLEKPIQADTLQEMFINTVAAWVNMLLLSSSGPIKTPVGACATAIESIELAVDAIQSGRARCVVTGGYDDFGEEGSFEFASMKATSDSEKELAAGRSPKEMSRPATTSRAGFMESHGSGVQVLMSAELAIEMGAPIYGVIALVSTATDKASRSVPAPGQGILTTAREKTQNSSSFSRKLLDPNYRFKQLQRETKAIDEWEEDETELIRGDELPEEETNDKIEEIRQIGAMRRRKAQESWSLQFFVGNSEIAPLRGALSVFGLSVDDIGVATFHGTGTKANDINESQVLHRQLKHLGRTAGNVCLSIFQKHLTGHPKGAAGAWMLNGLMQSMLSGVVPGNGNADNIDLALEKYDHIAHINKSLHTYGFEAGLLKSFGFGQVGGEVLVVHPDYILAQLSDAALAKYCIKRTSRYQAASRHWQNAITGKAKFVNVKSSPPYSSADESRVYLDPTARAAYSSTLKTWTFGSQGKSIPEEIAKAAAPATQSAAPSASIRRSGSASALTNLEIAMRELGEGLRQPSDRGIGVDAQLISEIDISLSSSPEFLSRNFSPDEIAYCNASADPIASFAGRWAAKEAVIKALSSSDTGNLSGQLNSSPGSSSSSSSVGIRNLWAGAGAPLKDIEILSAASGAPKVHLKGHPAEVANMLGITSISVSITHSGDYAFAQAVARAH